MLCADGHGTIAVVPWLRSNKCETAGPAATNLQHAKTVDATQKQSIQRDSGNHYANSFLHRHVVMCARNGV
jgi:hypothetical protein